MPICSYGHIATRTYIDNCLIIFTNYLIYARHPTRRLQKKLERPSWLSVRIVEMSYIYCDLHSSARKILSYKWSRTYEGLLTKKEGWYIDDRANPYDFWALMCVAHPEIASENIVVSKTRIQKAIKLIFESNEILRQFHAQEKEKEEALDFIDFVQALDFLQCAEPEDPPEDSSDLLELEDSEPNTFTTYLIKDEEEDKK